MNKFGKDMFGGGFNLKAEVTNGQCPHCDLKTVFVSLYENVYRCMQCGGDTEQKVNGVISYIPTTMVGSGRTLKMELESDGTKET
jgi:uncharacterized protein (DUF983 family)